MKTDSGHEAGPWLSAHATKRRDRGGNDLYCTMTVPFMPMLT
jgi:hypothetical protein